MHTCIVYSVKALWSFFNWASKVPVHTVTGLLLPEKYEILWQSPLTRLCWCVCVCKTMSTKLFVHLHCRRTVKQKHKQNGKKNQHLLKI